MAFQSDAFQSDAFQTTAAAPTSTAVGRPRRLRLPRVYCTVEGQVVDVTGWSANSRANLGCDRFTGRAAAQGVRRLPSQVEEGARLELWTEDGVRFWAGDLGRPRVQDDGTAVLAASGDGHGAGKYSKRIPLLITDPAAFGFAHQPPLNFPTDFNVTGLSLGTSRVNLDLPEPPTVDNAVTVSSTGSGTRVAIALWAPGIQFHRLAGGLVVSGADDIVSVGTAHGPNIAATFRKALVRPFSTGSVESIDVSFPFPDDCVIVEWFSPVAETLADENILGPIRLYGYSQITPLYTEVGAKAIGDLLGWDTSRIRALGGVALDNFDWAGGAESALHQLAGIDDVCWGVFPHPTPTERDPELVFERYDKTWEFSRRRGARSDLEPLETYDRVVVQYRTTGNQLGQAIIESPSPSGLGREAQVNLANPQAGISVPYTVGWRTVQMLLGDRWRGTTSTAHAFEAASGRNAPYEVRPGHLARIIDHSRDGALTVRIVDVEYSPDGITMGHDAPAVPIGVLSAFMGAYQPNLIGRDDTATGTVINQQEGTPTYLPPESPGAPRTRWVQTQTGWMWERG